MPSRMVLFQPSIGGYLVFPTLSEHLRRATYPLYEMRQFARPEYSEAKTGEIHYFNRIGRVLTVVNPVGEQEQGVPLPVPTISRGSVVVQDYLAFMEFTERLERFAEWDVQEIITETLKFNMAHNLDLQVANVLKQAPVKAVPSSQTSTTFVTSGSVPQAGFAGFRSAHLKDIADYFRLTLQVPPYDGTNYVGILHGAAIRSLYDEVTDAFLKYTSPEVFYRSEVGSWYNVRLVQTNNADALKAAAGTGSNRVPEGIFLAADPIIEVISVPEEIRSETVANTFGRIKRIGWFFSGAWALTWDTPNPGECRVIYYTSG
jgi:N4-gp56 family major capsid protein